MKKIQFLPKALATTLNIHKNTRCLETLTKIRHLICILIWIFVINWMWFSIFAQTEHSCSNWGIFGNWRASSKICAKMQPMVKFTSVSLVAVSLYSIPISFRFITIEWVSIVKHGTRTSDIERHFICISVCLYALPKLLAISCLYAVSFDPVASYLQYYVFILVQRLANLHSSGRTISRAHYLQKQHIDLFVQAHIKYISIDLYKRTSNTFLSQIVQLNSSAFCCFLHFIFFSFRLMNILFHHHFFQFYFESAPISNSLFICLFVKGKKSKQKF